MVPDLAEAAPPPAKSSVEPLKRSSSAAVVEGVADLIAQGALGTGSVLPSERSLAAHFKVNRKAVRRALMLLAENGVLQSHGLRARTIAPAALEILAIDRAKQTGVKTSAFMQHCMVVLTPHVHEDRRGFIAAISNGVFAGIRQAGFDLIQVHPNKLANGVIDASVTELLDSRPAGVLLPEIFGPVVSKELMSLCRELGIPAVVYGGHAGSAQHDRILSDHDAGAYALTKWLIGQGRKRILQISPVAETYWFGGRRSGYERAVREAGLELLAPLPIPSRNVDRSEWTVEYFSDAVRHSAGYLFPFLHSPHPVDAIMALSDSSGHQVIGACEYLGKRAHKDVTVVGYDNNWADGPDLGHIPVSVAATVEKQNFESGIEMVRLMRERLEGKLPSAPQTRVMTPQLVVVQQA
jgi:DNA-binding LacI/PurR family transcriptional regulator